MFAVTDQNTILVSIGNQSPYRYDKIRIRILIMDLWEINPSLNLIVTGASSLLNERLFACDVGLRITYHRNFHNSKFKLIIRRFIFNIPYNSIPSIALLCQLNGFWSIQREGTLNALLQRMTLSIAHLTIFHSRRSNALLVELYRMTNNSVYPVTCLL